MLVAGFCGYVGGKMSYMKKCIEKFKDLENSPLGEALRQQQRPQQPKWETHTHKRIQTDTQMNTTTYKGEVPFLCH